MALDEYVPLLTELVYPMLMAASIGMTRALGVILITPAFNRLGLTGMIRSAVAVTIALPAIPFIFSALPSLGPMSAFGLAALLVKELIIGAVIGVVFGIPFWAAEVAGEVVDLQRASTMGQLLDPMGSTESGVTSTLLVVTLVALFFASGGFMILLEGFYASYALWPVERFVPVLEARSALMLLDMLDQVMRVGVMMVAPLLVALLVADLMLAYLARMAPSLHVFSLSLAIKNLLFTFLMLLYVVFLIPLLMEELGALGDGYRRLETLLSGIPPLAGERGSA
ncbi:type III secretion system export apparatus subunit SctT [Halomonas sp. MCCC 1A17488]|uniref:type III secretion system export apparatus subunit SctT n=1 Tax=unclassified Halomonas TaxID=2609666 RepID=UPI0018D21976|nr:MULTISPECIES: type III secretion system export apparatus subunit SctT [unclassified Halomonas]MCE8016448.1 type III secretion system export apparatus subunit SctT [Halomonas sp. MCCC 1A17488]MCG3239781.1 type III secretion system export apparatus subunit SctT [Halomonas sp. MCCC 1A17488]QPP50318.1 type III secretion system export apparatus subunit SctT [Halomonas sp. SS10-MC5]